MRPLPPTRAAWLALPLSVLVAVAACGEDEPKQQQMNPAMPGATAGSTAGTTAGTAGGTTAGSVGGTTAGTGTTAGSVGGTTAGSVGGTTAGTTAGTAGGSTAGTTGGSTAGTAGGTTAGTGGTSDAGAAMGDAGTPAGDSGTGATGLKAKCEGGETMGCSSFMAPSGMELQLGPYGAAMEANVGKGFENMLNPSDTDEQCLEFAATFGQTEEENKKVTDSTGLDKKLYSIYRPANWKDGEKYPLLSWGNGTCAQPEGYGTLLRFIASHGFVIVAANSRYVSTDNAMKRALDFMFAANADMASPYYQRLDLEKVGAMGHSQGSSATGALASDTRVKAVILYNGGSSASKPFFAISGEKDIPFFTSLSGFRSAVNAAPKAAFMWMYMVPGSGLSGHLTLMTQPERLTDASVAWWKVVLQNDPASKEYFVGSSCKLCNRMAEFAFGQKGLE